MKKKKKKKAIGDVSTDAKEKENGGKSVTDKEEKDGEKGLEKTKEDGEHTTKKKKKKGFLTSVDKMATTGAVTGAAAGIVLGPIGIVAGAGIGYAIGKTASKLTDAHFAQDYWKKTMKSSLGKSYKFLAREILLEIQCLVFVKKPLWPRISKVKTASKATGVGNILGNKGGAAISFCVGGTSVAIVSCHLAAHEGPLFRQARNQNVHDILRYMSISPAHDLHMRHHHVLLVGDLNYRIEPELSPEEAARPVDDATAALFKKGGKKPSKDPAFAQKWVKTESLATSVHTQAPDCSKALSTLLGWDELGRERAAEHVMLGFQEGAVEFAPTFKVKRDVPDPVYLQQRIPAFCDRVLWHSLPGQAGQVQLREYKAEPAVVSSDHKPVFARFSLAIPPSNMPSAKVHIAIQIHKVSLLLAKSVLGKKGASGEEHPSTSPLLSTGMSTSLPSLPPVSAPSDPSLPPVSAPSDPSLPPVSAPCDSHIVVSDHEDGDDCEHEVNPSLPSQASRRESVPTTSQASRRESVARITSTASSEDREFTAFLLCGGDVVDSTLPQPRSAEVGFVEREGGLQLDFPDGCPEVCCVPVAHRGNLVQRSFILSLQGVHKGKQTRLAECCFSLADILAVGEGNPVVLDGAVQTGGVWVGDLRGEFRFVSR
eukprot:CAMPEP_0177651656 /NCGR_PEP_ID=MMETSP0447-20121125/12679_1 /TAXON_ID=0 /ORGANISM="Stygamoeba regulata, Strain BSH-02190019" /LENGTH=653 /DNA_ID=CAMNT_0019154781 /DNA_START=9 /DNA_END=1970 /DNA_ORIENTATION=+